MRARSHAVSSRDTDQTRRAGGQGQRSRDVSLTTLFTTANRPPESYCILKSANGSVYWRDSHRRKQYDFDTEVRPARQCRRHVRLCGV